MNQINADRLEILKRVKANRAVHAKIVKEANIGYRKAVIKELAKRLDEVRSGKPINVNFNMSAPQSYLKDYDTIIDMLTMSTDSIIVMEAESFRHFVRDEWNWSANFLAVNARYSKMAQASFDGGDLGQRG